MMNKKLLGIIAVVAVLAIGAFVMMGGGGPKPEETFEQIKAAAMKKDVVGVEKYVDFDSLAKSIARSDFIMGAEADNPELSPLTAGFVAHAAKAFRAIVAAGNLKEGAGKDPFSDALYDLQKNTGFRNWSYICVAGTKVDGEKAVASIKIKDNALDKEYTLDVDLVKENDVWRVKEIVNLSAFAAQRSQDVKTKLAELNKEIAERIAKDVVITDAKMTYFKDDDFFFGGDKVKLSLTLSNKTQKTISKIYGYAELYKENAEKPIERYSFNLPNRQVIEPGKKIVLTDKYRLQGDDEVTVATIVKNFGSYPQKFTVMSVEYTDGNSLKQLNRLPD